jgi:hypothetical protein
MPLPIDLFEEKLRSGDLRGITGDLNTSTTITRYQKKCLLIYYGLCTELYEGWATDDDKSPDYDPKIQYKLAEHDYCHDILIHSRHREAKRKILEMDITRALDPDIMRRNDKTVHDLLMHDMEPNLDVLRAYLKIIPTSDFQNLYTKLKAMEAPVTTFETTMSPAQLYNLGNPAWARGLTAYGIKLAYDAMDGFQTNRQPVNMEVILEAIGSGLISKYTILKYCMETLGVELWYY